MWYREDFATIEGLPPSPTEHVPFDKILEAAAHQVESLKTHYHAPLRRWVPPVTFFVTDAGRPTRSICNAARMR